MTIEQQVDLYLRALCPLLVLVTPEEDRALGMIKTVCEKAMRLCLTWDVAEGFVALTPGMSCPTAREPMLALQQIDEAEGDGLFVLKDFHDCWSNPPIKRKLRNLVQRLKFGRKSILITTPGPKVPEELKDEAVILHFPPPGLAELEAVLERLTRTAGVKVNLSSPGREKLIQSALGLTAAQAQRAFARAIAADGGLDDRYIELVAQEKRQVIRQSEALEFYHATEAISDVGGLDALKQWLRLRERAWSREARAYGLPVPKGIALIGIPGTGKSLVAKMIAGLWRLPLFRLDAGALFGCVVGESEERTRRALRVAEAAGQAILWIDEVEKALAPGGLDSGTSARVFATLLTWMQEKSAPIFTVATANSIHALPPELLRKGRFDEVFFLDLPTMGERREILAVHLRKRGRVPAHFDLDQLSHESEGYVGAELEQSVLDAMYAGFSADREITTADILQALKRLVPLSVSQREAVQALRSWLHEGRAQSASVPMRPEGGPAILPMELHRPT